METTTEAIAKKWFEDQELWEMKGTIIFNRDHLRFAFMEVHQLLRLTGMKEEMSVLDLCCGVGRHSLSLAKSGLSVTGVDITASYLEKARENAHREGLNIEYVQEDARTFRRREAFDLIINMFTSFGYFETPEEDKQLLENCYDSLRPGGRLVIELLTRETVIKQFREQFDIAGNGYSVNVRQQISAGADRLLSWWTISYNGWEKEVAFSVRLYSADQLEQLLTDCGFRNFKAWGDLHGSAYDHRAKKLVAVCEKPQLHQDAVPTSVKQS